MSDSPDAAVAGDVGSRFDEAWAETPAVEAPEPPVPDAPVPETAPSAPAAPRDPKGRFTKQDSPPVAPAPSEPVAPPSADTPAATPPETPPVEGKPPEPEVVYPEFEYTVNGRPLNIPGSKVGEDGVFIPTAQIERFTRTQIAGHLAGQREKQHQQEVQAARNEGQIEVQKARQVLQAFGELTKDKEKLLAWAENLNQNRELLLTRAELAAVKAEKDQVGSKWNEHEQTQAAQALVPQLQDGLKSVIGTLAKKPDYAGVDTAALFDRLLQRHFDQVFSEDESGEILLDQGFIEDEMQYEAAVLARGRAEARKTSQVAEKNRQALQQPPTPATNKRAAPPAPKTPAGAGKPGSFQEALDDAFGAGWKDL